MWCRLKLHKWTPWTQPFRVLARSTQSKQDGRVNLWEWKQTRTCRRCGIVEDRESGFFGVPSTEEMQSTISRR